MRGQAKPIPDSVLERQLAAAIPGSRLVVYQDTGHLVCGSSRIEAATDLTAFVEGLETATTG